MLIHLVYSSAGQTSLSYISEGPGLCGQDKLYVSDITTH